MHSPRRSPRRSSRGRGHINLYTGNTRVPKTYVGGAVEKCPYCPNNQQKKLQLQCQRCQITDKLSVYQCGHVICIRCARSQATLGEINHELIEILTNLVLHPKPNSVMFNHLSNDDKLFYIRKFREDLDKRAVAIDLSDFEGTVWRWLKPILH